MKSQLLFALFGLTGVGASGQLFVPGAMHMPPPAAVHRPPVFAPNPAHIEPAELPAPDLVMPSPVVRPPDRMMITGGAELYNERVALPPTTNDIADAGEGVAAWETTFRGPWHQGRGVRFRLVFLNAAGVTWYERGQFWLSNGRRTMVAVSAPPDTTLRESYAVYPAGQRVWFNVEVENTSGRELRNVEIRTRQLPLDHSGRTEPGAMPESRTYTTIERLAASKGTRRQASFILSRGGAEAPVNFQASHVTVHSDGEILADVKKAAVIDPPATF